MADADCRYRWSLCTSQVAHEAAACLETTTRNKLFLLPRAGCLHFYPQSAFNPSVHSPFYRLHPPSNIFWLIYFTRWLLKLGCSSHVHVHVDRFFVTSQDHLTENHKKGPLVVTSLKTLYSRKSLRTTQWINFDWSVNLSRITNSGLIFKTLNHWQL